MLGKLFEITTAAVSSTYDAAKTTAEFTYETAADAVDYVIEDIKSIPDSIEKGWNEGLFSSPSEPETPEQTNQLSGPLFKDK